jgi:perosamine synthetase
MNESSLSIPVYKPYLGGNESLYVINCLKSGWISSKGEYIEKFEKKFSACLGNEYATSVCNGTVALHLALKTLGIGPGDEVIVPTFTYIASVNAIHYVGAKPIFVDSESLSWNLDPDLIEGAISPRTKAILAVHLYGAPCNIEKISNICRNKKLYLIEDVAEALGSKVDNRYVGSHGDIATFSFFGNKTITTGEGGMLVSNQKSIIERAAYLKSQAVSPVREYWHDEVGFNYRMTNICAAIGLAQLEQFEVILEKKRQIAQWYRHELSDTSLLFQLDNDKFHNSYWMVSVLAIDAVERDNIREYLRKNGVETRPFFYPAHTMPSFQSDQKFPIAESLSACGLNLPSYPDLLKKEVIFISSLIKTALNLGKMVDT